METNFLAVDQTAKALAQEKVDDTELAKVLTYLKATRDERKTRELLRRFAETSDFSRSGQTKWHFKKINELMSQHLSGDIERDVQFIGWVRRLLKYHKS